MKKIFSIIGLVALAFGANAQVTVTPEVGYSFGKFSGYTYDPVANMRHTRNYDWRATPRAGIAFDIPIGNKGFSIEPGIYFHSRVGRIEENTDKINIKTISTQNYAEIPINLKYSWEVAPYSGKLFFQLSPFIGYGISGQTESDVEIKIPIVSKQSITNQTKWGSAIGTLNPLNYGFNVGVGYQFQMGLQIRTIYGFNAANFSNVENEVATLGSVFNISIGYVLGRKLPGRFY